MSIISKVGRKSWHVRLVVGSIYALLVIGAVSMMYPLMLMFSGSVKSNADFYWITPIPRYLYDNDVLWMKYLESKYGLAGAEMAHHQSYGSFQMITRTTIDDAALRQAKLFSEFREEFDWPLSWYSIGHLGYGQNQRAYRRLAEARFSNDITAYSDAVRVRYKSWTQVVAPRETLEARHFNFPKIANFQIFDHMKRQAPSADRVFVNLDGVFWYHYLRPKWPRISEYNRDHGTNYTRYSEVLLSATPPANEQARNDWEDFVRYDLNIQFIHIDPAVIGSYQAFLSHRHEENVEELNRLWGTAYQSFAEISLPQGAILPSRAHLDYSEFLKDPEACPLAAISVHGPRQAFERFLRTQQGAPVSQIRSRRLPLQSVDYADFQKQIRSLRWEFIKRNYLVVFDYILLHGNGIRNTVIYCSLMILATLLINPLAAYALSRYKPPSAYKILLFCMCTMAFPSEVTMISAFLLLKRFPLIGLVVAAAAGVAAAWIIHKTLPKLPDWAKGVASGIIGLVAGFYALPEVFGRASTSVSLLNTFWALILPGMANGFGIFLLKGFFDSLPRELYESADIDGAGEWIKFWVITMSLSKPILAVIALGAFTAAYSEFMMALVIIPDPKMWTLMVWLFQLQSQVSPSVVNASLVIAAIPTLMIFLFCQNIIMRGIVVPVEK